MVLVVRMVLEEAFRRTLGGLCLKVLVILL